MKDTNSITIAYLREGIWNKARKTKEILESDRIVGKFSFISF